MRKKEINKEKEVIISDGIKANKEINTYLYIYNRYGDTNIKGYVELRDIAFIKLAKIFNFILFIIPVGVYISKFIISGVNEMWALRYASMSTLIPLIMQYKNPKLTYLMGKRIFYLLNRIYNIYHNLINKKFR